MIIIAERINATRQDIKEALEKRDEKILRSEAEGQIEAGADYLDVNTGLHPDVEKELMIWACETIQEATDKPLCIDSSNPQVIEAGLKAHRNGKPLVNSISMKKGEHESVIPLVKEYGASVIALAQDDSGIPKSVDDRLKIVEKIVETCSAAGIEISDIFIDPLILAVSSDIGSGRMALESVREIKKHWPGIRTAAGASNISFGLPGRALINRTFISMLIASGLDAGIIDPTGAKMRSAVLAGRMLAGQDEYCMDFIRAFRAGKLEI